ncbi:alkaline phosphatase [Pelomonas sp. KK5]|uniref:alkaline phosphatase D family protein n=1 Tax=Pelomonas sp. KK5 TaxID=1855730 RepID=UPI0009F912FD|nr:alkaline phosphatase D family protein [Pelomonas sp. KK5]
MIPTPPDRLRRALLQASLAAACAPAFVPHARAADVERFALGIASGSPRPDRLVLWTRLGGEGLPEQVPVDWELAEDEAFGRIVARGREMAVAEDAHSVHAEPAGLKPDRWYWYRFGALGRRSAVGRTRTAPAPDAAVERLRFAIASCQRWDHGLFTAWGDAARQDLDLVLFLGDYIYEYGTAAADPAPRHHSGGPCRTLAAYRQRYAQYKADPLLQAAHARCPWITIWDDHETENDWASGTSESLDPDFDRRRAAAAKAYWEHMPMPKAARPSGFALQIHARYDWGRLARLVMLDDRQFRDPQVCPPPGRWGSTTVSAAQCPALLDDKRTLLGAAQEKWLAGSWDDTRPWNLLGQQTLMMRAHRPAARPEEAKYWTDGWDGYPGARARLLADLAARKIDNAVVLGGDVHANYVADLHADPDDTASPLLASEFCATSISSHGGKQAALDAIRPLNPQLHYARNDERGYMAFELTPRRLDARLRCIKGDVWDAASPVGDSARFAVEAGRPGVQAA